MAILFMDGFDAYNGLLTSGTSIGADSGWTFPSTTQISIAAGRMGGQAAYTNIFFSGRFAKYFTPTSQFVCGHSFYQSTLSLSLAVVNPYISFFSDGTPMMGLKVNSDGSISACRITALNNGTILGTSASNVIRGGTWHSIEFACSISDTTGTVTVAVDGVTVLNLTNQNTRNGTPTTINGVILGGCDGGFNTPNLIDDLYLKDTLNLLGPMRIETLRPNADTAQKQWTPSTGADNYGVVDETLMSSTDYVSTDTVGNFDLYDFGNLSSSPSSIAAVEVVVAAAKDDIGVRGLAISVKSGASTSDGANNTLSSSYVAYSRILETDPNTSDAWSSSAVNALQAGAKVTY